MPAFVPPPRFRPPEPRTPLPQYRGDFPSLLALLRKALSKTGEDIPVSASVATTIAQAILALAAKAPDPTEGNLAALDAQGNPVDSGTKPSDFQSKLTFDTTPTAGSQNPVTSGGIKSAIDAATPEDYAEVKAQVQTNTGAITDVQRDIADVKAKIPAQATARNQLADKEFVNSSIATNTATFRGTYNLASDLGLTTGATHEQVAAAVAVKLAALSITPDHNDYCFVQVPRDDTDPTVIDRIDRYKCSVEGGVASWDYEWSLNNSSFTAVQWAAINSGITSGAVVKLNALPTAQELAQALAGKASTADATLTPIYSDTPTFSEWVTDVESFPNIEWDDGNGCWKVYTSGGDWFTPQYGGHDYYAISLYDGAQVFTATRNRTDIIGYQLGDQTDKPLQPKGNYQPAGDYPTRADIDEGWWSEWEVEPDDGVITSIGRIADGPELFMWVAYNSGGFWVDEYAQGAENATHLEFDSGEQIYTATRHRVAAPVPTKPEDIGALPASSVVAPSPSATAGQAADAKATGDALEPLLFAQYYPDGSVKNAAEFTQGIKYNFDTTSHTATVKPFCNTRTSDDNSSLAGRVVVPPFVDASGNGYISDDGTRYKVVGVSDGESLGATSSLTAIVAPSTVTTVGQYAFMDCDSLTSVSLPAATAIGESAFDGCTSLTSVSLPAVTNIGGQAFNSCTSLSSVSLPAATTIGEYAFINCTALTSVLLPAVTTVGNGAFMDCSSLDSVDFDSTPRSSVPMLGTDAFSGVPASCKIIVPYTQYDAWVAANGWSDLLQEFVRHAEKMDKPATFTTGHLAEFDASGNPVDSGWAVEALARYAHVTKTVDNGAATLDDLAINAVGLPGGTASATLTLPAAVPGRVRDFIVRLTLAAAASVSFSSVSGETVAWDSSGDPSGTFQAGTHLLSFTEVAPGVFRWGRPQTDLTGQTFDFSTMQGVMDALAAVVTALGGSVLNKPSAI